MNWNFTNLKYLAESAKKRKMWTETIYHPTTCSSTCRNRSMHVKNTDLIHFDANDNIDRKGTELHTCWRLRKHIALKTHTHSTLEFPSCALKSPSTEEITLLVIDINRGLSYACVKPGRVFKAKLISQKTQKHLAPFLSFPFSTFVVILAEGRTYYKHLKTFKMYPVQICLVIPNKNN